MSPGLSLFPSKLTALLSVPTAMQTVKHQAAVYVLASYCCSNGLPQTQWLKTTQIYLLSYSSGGQSPKSNMSIRRCQQGYAPSGSSRRKAILCLFQLWGLVMTSLQYSRPVSSDFSDLPHISLLLCAFKSPTASLLQGHMGMLLGSTWISRITSPSPDWLIITHAKTHFPS